MRACFIPASDALLLAGALERAGVSGDDVQEVFMGNVLSANLGQVPVIEQLLWTSK